MKNRKLIEDLVRCIATLSSNIDCILEHYVKPDDDNFLECFTQEQEKAKLLICQSIQSLNKET